MPMAAAEDYPLGDTSKDWCAHCARQDGSLKSYDEALEGMMSFMISTQGIPESAARDAASTYMKTMPAWKDAGG